MITNAWTERIKELEAENTKLKEMVDRIRDHYRYNSFIIHSGTAILEYLEKLEQKFFPEGENLNDN